MACQHDYPILEMLPQGKVPTFTNVLSAAVDLHMIPEKDALCFFKETCQYLLDCGNLHVNRKNIMVRCLLLMFLNVLLNNVPLEWKFENLQLEIIELQDYISDYNM